tara:strand:+ start:2221 stop:2409 length:189 start_codon:yes stop_codon:yes gene_type:complete
MELDPVTKWLVRISSSIIIALGVILIFAIPIIFLKVGFIISLTQEVIKSDFKNILTALLSKI